MDELTTEGVPVWLVSAVLGVIFLAQAFPRVLGPVGSAIDSWAQSRRQAAIARDDADIAERDRQIAYLQGVADERRRELDERDRLVVEHLRWDRQAITHSPHLGPAPPLWPAARPTTDPDAQEAP